MSEFKLEKLSKNTNEWEMVKASKEKEALESIIDFDGDSNEWRILCDNEVSGHFSFNGHYQETQFDLNGRYTGLDVLKKLETSPYLKDRGYVIQNSYTCYKEEGTVIEIERGERIQEVNQEKSLSHDVFFECFDDDLIYLQILPFKSQEKISSLSFTLNSGEPMTVLKDMHEWLKEL